jgi:uncharacterized protein YciI
MSATGSAVTSTGIWLYQKLYGKSRVVLRWTSEPSTKDQGMLFLFVGFLKPHTEQQVLALRDEFNEHLAQPFPRIALGGVLRDEEGRKIGYAAVIEAEDLTAVTDYLERSPFQQNGLYDVARVAEFNQELGSVELTTA